MIPGRRAVLALVAAGLLCALAAQGREARLFATPSEVERFGTEGRLTGPFWALAHDAYHPLPGQFCEGKPGSGVSFRLKETAAATRRKTR